MELSLESPGTCSKCDPGAPDYYLVPRTDYFLSLTVRRSYDECETLINMCSR